MEPDAAQLRNALADRLVADGWIESPRIEDAFRHVPRHVFLPATSVREAYQNKAIALKSADDVLLSSSSQPSLMALMLEELRIAPGSRILEIGTGSGYNAAIMARLVGGAGRIVTADIDEDVAAHAREALRKAGADNVEVIHRDGGFGHAAGAPYDGIIITATAADITPAWWDQLAPDGRLIVPLSIRGVKQLVAFVKESGSVLRSVSAKSCAFIDLRGAFQDDHESHLRSELRPGCRMTVRSPRLDADEMFSLLRSPRSERALPLAATVDEMLSGLAMWLALKEPDGFAKLHVELAHAGRDAGLPVVWRNIEHAFTHTFGLASRHELAFLHLASSAETNGNGVISVLSYGDADGVSEELARRAMEWAAEGRPTSRSMRVTATRLGAAAPSANAPIHVALPHATLLLSFEA
jgi:protein-L-isoaspartate(D-aspartate) O-methyltransferase